jgi:hypothetical protein
LLQQLFGLLQVERVEALGEPAIDQGEKIAGLLPFTVIAPQPPMLVAARSSQDFAC